MMKNNILVAVLLIVVVLASCTKGAGPGGRSTIKGKVWAKNLDKTMSIVRDSGYVADEKVFISYGDVTAIGQDVSTSHDGSFLFEYLRPGKYTIWCLSKKLYGINLLDTTIKQEINISSNGDEVTTKDIVIYTNKN
jgi:hypothetical protein